MAVLGPQMKEFHTKVGGDVQRIAAFFLDLAPEAQRVQGMPAGMINALLRIDPSAKTCAVSQSINQPNGRPINQTPHVGPARL